MGNHFGDGISHFQSRDFLTSTVDGLRIDFVSSQDDILIPFIYTGVLQKNTIYTISFQYRGNITSTGTIYLDNDSGGNFSMGKGPDLVVSTTEWQKCVFTLNTGNRDLTHTNCLSLFYSLDGTGWVEVKKESLKMELGNIANPVWTPAELDMQQDLNVGYNILKYTQDLANFVNATHTVDKICINSSGKLTKTNDGIKLNFENSLSCIYIPVVTGLIKSNTKYTISFEYRGNITTFGSVYFERNGGGNLNAIKHICPDLINSPSVWRKHRVVVSTAGEITDSTPIVWLGLFYGTIRSATDWIEIKNCSLKLQTGEVYDTIWSSNESDQNITTQTNTNITGLLKGNGSKVVAAVAGTDYLTTSSGKAASASSADKVNHTLTFTGGSTATFNGSANVSVAIPTSLKNPNKLTFSGASTATYDGSAAVTVNIPSASTYTAGTGISISSNTISLATSGVSSGTYGSSTTIPVISVDAYGRITSISNYAISPVNISGLIWTNYSYTSELIAQTYTFNNPFNYNIFFIEFMLSTGLTYIRRFAMANGVAGLMGFITGSGAYGGNQTEGITTSTYETLRSWNVVSSTSIRFFECWYYTTSGTTGMHTTANLLYIPYRIWGTKYLCQ